MKENIKKRKTALKKFGLLLTTTFVLGLQFPAHSQTVLETIKETGVLKVAIREDAAPFGYVNSADNLQGFCLDFFALLETKLEEQLPRNSLATRLLKSTVSNRFNLIEEGLSDIECGPNTIRELSSTEVTFSRPFFDTRTQFLVATEQVDVANLDGDLANIKIGVIRNTTTEELIRERYPDASIVLFSGVTARTRGVQAVAQGKIAAMASDGILLRAEAAQQDLPVADFALIPTASIDCENLVFARSDRYGMIIPKDAQWQDFVNSVIVSPEFQRLFAQWFRSIQSFPTEEEIDNGFCS